MPIGFLTRAERERLNRFPAQIPDEELHAIFLLSDADQTAINKQRKAHTRLGVCHAAVCSALSGVCPG